MLKKISLILLLAGVLIFAGEVDSFARRGGSFGGRSFSSSRSYGGSRSYGSSRSYGGYRSYGYGGGYRTYGYGGGGVVVCGGGAWVVFAIIAALIVITVIASIAKRGGSGGLNSGVMVKLQLAFYAEQGGKIRNEIVRIGESANTSSPEGIAKFLNSIMIFVGRNVENISHCYYKSSAKMNIDTLENQFESEVSKEKMKYSADHSDANYKQKDELEIQQHVVLTTLVATNMLDFAKIQGIVDQHQLKDIANKIAGLPAHAIFAVEVIVTPSRAEDSLSRETLELQYPELKIL